MRNIKLGNSGLDVSPIALGCMTYGEPDRGHPVWSLPEDESRPLIQQAVDTGINFFDTANMYSQGSTGTLHRPGASARRRRRVLLGAAQEAASSCSGRPRVTGCTLS
jgi:aryl-alcohol dehydrogenase-like predicted oxidoreductase